MTSRATVQTSSLAYSHGELVVVGSRVSMKTVNSVGGGPAYQDSAR